MIFNEIQFIKGFNAGYLLAKYEPQLLIGLLDKISPINSYVDGMSNGVKEYELERTYERLNELESLKERQSREKDRQ